MLIKLSEYGERINVSYITAYRWFKEGKLPVPAHQTESGTILVEVEDKPTVSEENNQAVAQILKKVVDCKVNNIQIEDFAAWVISTFILKCNESITYNKPSFKNKNKPKSEDIQNHYSEVISKITTNQKGLSKIKEIIKSNKKSDFVLSEEETLKYLNSFDVTTEEVELENLPEYLTTERLESIQEDSNTLVKGE